MAQAYTTQDVLLGVEKVTSSNARVTEDVVLGVEKVTSSHARTEQDVVLAIKQPTNENARVPVDLTLVVWSNNRLLPSIRKRIRHQQRRKSRTIGTYTGVLFRMSLTVTANLVDLSGSANAGWAIFTLVGFGLSVPKISGSVLSNTVLKAQANGSGAISQIILGNDVISPVGTTWQVQIFSSTGALISSGRYSLTGTGTVDLSTQTQL